MKKISFNEVNDVMYVVIIDPSNMIAKITLKIGLMAIATSAKGMSAYESFGLNKKHNIPSRISKLITPATIILVSKASFLFKSFPSFVTITEQKKVFCVV